MITPPFLRPGDFVAITAPASRVALQDVLSGVKILEQWGFKTETGATAGRSFHNFSDTFENRLQELQGFLDDPEVRCILAARGGYGVSDLIDHLDFTAFKKHPKWIIGFSDLTALLLHLNASGYETIHGPMAKTLTCDPVSSAKLRDMLSGKVPSDTWPACPSNREGHATGPAIGGNLVLLTHSIGSVSDISYDGKILFLEDIGEKLYNIDRMMVQLKRAGKLKHLAGLVAGSFTAISEPSFGFSVEEIILQHTAGYDYPVAFGFQFGHESVNLPVIMGRTYDLDVTPAGVTLKTLENVVI
ncbi:LD-carboxypeptidase [Leadbetterella sp. DM7]|uniref:S66 peptidase family protein n=1 Tax=Leadbetterella sp. DM7 TaxID=3235085 RepID=UPI00349E7203